MTSNPMTVSRLIVPRSAQGSGTKEWMGGTLLAWDSTTYANTVEIGGITYTNLPVVNPLGLDEGPVLIARLPSGLVIMGPINRPGAGGSDLMARRVLRNDISVINTTFFTAADDLAFPVQTNTTYAIDGMFMSTSHNSADAAWCWTGPPNMVFRWGLYGVPVSSLSRAGSIDPTVIDGYGFGIIQQVNGMSDSPLVQCQPRGYLSVGDTPGVVTPWFSQGVAYASVASVFKKGSWLRIEELGAGAGGTTITKTYAATATRTYMGDTTYNTAAGDVSIYHGDRGGGSGNERAIAIFPGSTMRSDMASATITSAKLWLYCHYAEEAKGSLAIKAESYTSFPTTYDPGYTNTQNADDRWDVNSWNYLDIRAGSGAILPAILSGANSIGFTPILFGAAATGFRGYSDPALRPYIEVTYTV